MINNKLDIYKPCVVIRSVFAFEIKIGLNENHNYDCVLVCIGESFDIMTSALHSTKKLYLHI
jgi:hypothetical protein